MSTTIDHSEAAVRAAMAPLRWWAAAAASRQEAGWALGLGGLESARTLVTAWAQGANVGLGWAEIGAKTLADAARSELLDRLLQDQMELLRQQVSRTSCAAMAAVGQPDVEPSAAAAVVFAAPSPRRGEQPQEADMKIVDCMTRDVQIADPNDTIAEAAKLMARLDAGVLPVGQNDRLVGMITDRDIAIGAVAEGKGPDAKVAEVMNAEVKYCFDDQDVDDVLRNMGDLQLRRMPVLNHDKRLVGIVSLGDLAGDSHAGTAGEALCGISRPGGQQSQLTH